FFISAIVSAVLVGITAFAYLPSSFSDLHVSAVAHVKGDPRVVARLSVLIGLVLASAIQLLTGYFTETSRRPVQDLGCQSGTCAATVILAGVSIGLESAVYAA